MGDRGNVAILYRMSDDDEDVAIIYLYTHWEGSRLPVALQDALRRAAPDKERGETGRWFDPVYMARIILDSLKGDDVDGLTGFGIAPFPPDTDHPILAVDAERREVFVLPDGFRGHRYPNDFLRSLPKSRLGTGETPGPQRWSFREFLAESFGPSDEVAEDN